MRKLLAILLATVMLASVLAACTGSNSGSESTSAPASAGNSESASADASAPQENAEIVDGRFTETRSITVEIYDRANDGGTPPDNNIYTDYIKEGLMRDHNIDVTFKTVPRWTEGEVLNNLLAAGDAPDICVTYSYPTILTYANMGGVHDLAPLVDENIGYMQDLVNLIGEDNIYYFQDPQKKTLWAIAGKRLNYTGTVRTFIREDWLKKLNMSEPTTLEEYEAALHAFKDNASELLGADADKMIPFMMSSWAIPYNMAELAEAYIPNDITDKDMYINGYAGKMLVPYYKEVARKLNEWYNAGLIWKDFALYGKGDETGGNLVKSGYVGAKSGDGDGPYRNGDNGEQQNIQKLFGPEAGYIAVPTFKNDAGVYKRFLEVPIDKSVFFPGTNKEPLASLIYLNWISKEENLIFLQTGEEGITHEKMPDGSVKTISAVAPNIMNSLYNLDYTIVCNGLNLGDPEKTLASIAIGYDGVDPRYIKRSSSVEAYDMRRLKPVVVGEIKAEEGMGTVLSEKLDTLLCQAIVASTDKFDSVYDSGMKDYLSSGAQAIIDERTAAWERVYGDKLMLD